MPSIQDFINTTYVSKKLDFSSESLFTAVEQAMVYKGKELRADLIKHMKKKGPDPEVSFEYYDCFDDKINTLQKWEHYMVTPPPLPPFFSLFLPFSPVSPVAPVSVASPSLEYEICV